MNPKSTLLSLFALFLIMSLTVNCAKKEDEDIPKPESTTTGNYTGTATNKANSADKKTLNLAITSSGNPVAGTYTLNGATGKITGSILGLILNMTLKPDVSGTTYTFSGAGDGTSLTGTMTGVESTTTVNYDVVVKK